MDVGLNNITPNLYRNKFDRIECTELPKFKRGVKEVFQRMNESNLYRKNFVQQTKQSATHAKLRTMPMVIDSIDSFVT